MTGTMTKTKIKHIVMLSPIEIDETHAMLCNLSAIVIEIWT